MIIKVSRGNYEIISKKSLNLKSDCLGAGIALGFINRSKQIYGLLTYLFPYKEFDLEIDGAMIHSGETILNKFQEELERLNVDVLACKWFLAGASVFKENPENLDLAEKNLKLAESWLKKMGIDERSVVKRVKLSEPLALEINGKELVFLLRIQNRIERYE
ncbi:MAG: hypothetical protein ABDI07_11225 [Candidatus Kryptonium sp.]